ncbi:DUF1672 family protein [Neobacillus sp. LXY-1]|uniref:DUF1672 family protein n=1 Tax=Neobacillus sp. LXY-1 TaxID=3379133 RepID=UPI003EE0E96A
MRQKREIYWVILISMTLILGGCSFISNETGDKKNAEDGYMPVQDYTGQGYSFNYGEKTGEFAKKHRQKIIDKVHHFFMEKYGLNVTVHNLVGAKNAVVAFVESKQNPKFHTSVMVGVDLQNQKVGGVGAYEGDVEGAITTGLYAMAYEKEFQNLDAFCERIVQKYPVMGMREEAVNNTRVTGYATPFYYISTSELDFPKAYDAFLKKNYSSNQDFRNLIEETKFNKKGMLISLTFYMKKQHSLPDKKIANEIIELFKQSKGFPPGNYGVFIESNDILKRTGTSKKDVGSTPGIDDIIIEPQK